MVSNIDPRQIYEIQDAAIIDVRTPAEFAHGHVAGAFNLPLFDDHEREQVGTRYHNAGKEAGFLLGLQLVGPKLAWYVKKIKALYPVSTPLVMYCWRGGMRSNSMAWLFSQAGYKVYLVNGGYKGFRSYIREQASTCWEFKIVGGMTGAGKTEVLEHLSEMGEQVLDLEALAHHKGSVFGHMGQLDQPENEQFENDLWDSLRLLDKKRPVYLEDESRSIGKVSIPEPFYLKMQKSTIFVLDVDKQSRINRLLKEYGFFNKEELESNLLKLTNLIGSEMCNKAIKEVWNDNIENAIDIVLHYYDKQYRKSIEKYPSREIIEIKDCSGNSRDNAMKVIENSTVKNETYLS